MLNLLKQGYQSRVPLDDCTIKTICKAANKGDSLASEVIEYVGRHLGKTIAIAINLFNPQKLLLLEKSPKPIKCCSLLLKAALIPVR